MIHSQLEFVACALGLLVAMISMIEIGRRMGVRRRASFEGDPDAGVGPVNAAIFGLLGLIIAFTFQGAASRFDARRTLIVEEANRIGTAWFRIDVLAESAQPAMRSLFREYLDSRIETYRKVPDMAAVTLELNNTARLQAQLWEQAVDAHRKGGSAVAVSLMPALNQMFDIVTTRTMAGRSHPPAVVFAMLAFLACSSAFIAGHGMSAGKGRSWVHILVFTGALAVTVLVILDMEFPRVGLVRVDSFDQVLVELRQSMK